MTKTCKICCKVTGNLVKAMQGLLKSGGHAGKCKFDMPNGSCSKHKRAYERRLKMANKALETLMETLKGEI